MLKRKGPSPYGNLQESQSSSEVQRCVPFIILVRVLQCRWITPDDSLDQGEIVQVDGAPQADTLIC